jgi:hypothetical protein
MSSSEPLSTLLHYHLIEKIAAGGMDDRRNQLENEPACWIPKVSRGRVRSRRRP